MVDTILDKLIYQSIDESNEIIVPARLGDDDTIIKPAILLSDIPVFFIGDKNMQNSRDKRIVFAWTANKNNGEGFDFTQRKISYGFHLQMQNTKSYLEIKDFLNQIEKALLKTILTGDLLTNYEGLITVEDITPIYLSENDDMEDITFFTEEVVISVPIVEDYTKESITYDSIGIRAEVKNDES